MEKKFSWNWFLIKITSRKFITAFTGFIAMILIAAKLEEGSISQIVSIIGSFLSLVGYMFSEAIVDKANMENPTAIENQKEGALNEDTNSGNTL